MPARIPATEARNPASRGLDTLPVAALLRTLWREDAAVHRAVGRALPALTRAVTAAAPRFRAGGRIIYVGAGTSGRLAAQDAAECTPTFALEPGRILTLMAGGADALRTAREGAEDDARAGARELAALAPGAADIVVGISASGTTPFTVAALREARRRGALAIAIACAPASPLAAAADLAVVAPTGAEVIAGSTRMKAGTAQKTLLNFFSTALMIGCGAVYDNLMVNLQPTNAKLRRRAAGILSTVAALAPERSARLLAAHRGNLKQAIVAVRLGLTPTQAAARLAAVDANLREALAPAQPRRKRKP